MAKRTIWSDKVVKQSEVAATLTALNLPENKFKLVPINTNHVMIIYVEKEIPNVDSTKVVAKTGEHFYLY